jgi:hypothetical protein
MQGGISTMGRGLIYTGLILLVLVVVFSTAIFPGMVKMPADYEQEYEFEGSVQVYNPQLGALVEIPTEMTRNLEATGVTDDDVLLLKQDITFYEATSGAPLGDVAPDLAILNSSEVYGLDRTERTNVSGEGDMSRSGQFTFPGDTQQETYQYWSSSTRTTLPATFEGEETYQDLDVYVFEINSNGNAYLPDPATGLPRTMDVYARIKVEPVSGIPVYALSRTTINLQHPLAGSMPVLINESEYTSDTIDNLSEEAKSAKMLILIASVYGFWGLVGLSIILIALGFFRATRS